MANLAITTEKTVDLSDNLLETVKIEDFETDYEGGLMTRTIEGEYEFYPVDFHNEAKLHFVADIFYQETWKLDDKIGEELEITKITAYDIHHNEVSLTTKQDNQAESLIQNAIIL